MKEYELIIEKTQPTCGGQSPKAYEFREVETDDPVAYVQAIEKDLPLSVQNEEDGSIVVEVDVEKHQMKYRFTQI